MVRLPVQFAIACCLGVAMWLCSPGHAGAAPPDARVALPDAGVGTPPIGPMNRQTLGSGMRRKLGKVPEGCSQRNLVRTALVTGTKTKGATNRVRDHVFAQEGSVWNAPTAVVLQGKGAELRVDLRRVHELGALALQGDNNDVYLVEGSTDGKRFVPLWRAQPSETPGLRTRQIKLPRRQEVRYLRVRGVGGDNFYSVSELRAYCQVPKPWPLKLRTPPHHTGWKMLTNPMMVWLKAWLAIAALITLIALTIPYPRRAPLRLPLPWNIALWVLLAGAIGVEVAARFGHVPRIHRDLFLGLRALQVVAGVFALLSTRPLFPKRAPPYRAWLQLPLLLGGLCGLVAWWWLGERLWLQVGLGVLGLWFWLRWANGDPPDPRPGRMQLIARAVYERRWVRAVWWLLLLGATAGTYFYVDAHPKLPPRGTVAHMRGILWAGGALVAMVLLSRVVSWLRRAPSFTRAAHFVVAVCGLLALSAWWNVGHFHFNHYIHIHEHYHYLLGAKYGSELRYTRLYDCTTVADHQDHLGKRVTERKVRDLSTDNDMVTTEAMIAHPERCTDHFSKERWQGFRRDVRFLRSRFSKQRWDRSQSDHGYNATPVWAVAGRLITEAVGGLDWTKLYYLGALDTALLLLMWAIVWWAFGWQATCVALVFWGCNFPARYYWNGGGFLRYDYLMWFFAGLSLLKKRYMFGAGLSLTYATGLRIFPGFVVAALVLKALARMVRERRLVLSRDHGVFAAGCIAMILVLVPASDWAMGGLDAWGEFAHNSEKHLKTALTNNMGLKTVLGWDWETRARFLRSDKHLDPFKDWKAARAHYYAKSTPLYYVLIFLFCLMLARACDREEDWVAACLGTGLIVVAAELTCYYYCFFAAYGLLWHRRRVVALSVVGFSITTSALYQAIPWNDDHFTAMSLAAYLLVLVVTAHAAFGRRLPPEQPGAR